MHLKKMVEKITDRLLTFEVVLDAVIGVLVDKKIITRSEIQDKIVELSSPEDE